MKSFALENIKKYQSRQRAELIKAGLYHCAEFLTLVGVVVLGIAIITIL
jgi:GH25 family lysozyme M1 (1,4-beta-N-acetylmuramidase)